MTAPTVEEQAAEQFAMRMLGVINDAALALMASVGHRTGLFQAMTGLAPGTSTEIAEAAGLLERYVREWLGAMVTGGVVRYDAATGRYVLPPEHAAFLTPAAGPDNLAAFARSWPTSPRPRMPWSTASAAAAGSGTTPMATIWRSWAS